MPQRFSRMGSIYVAAALPLNLNEPCFHQIIANAMHRAFGNTHLDGNFPEFQLRIIGNAQQHMGMVGQKRPLLITYGNSS
jgi:predicted 2-oxoglutarate/Fe(II)-dependent dioxygenase YbiX